VNTRKLNLGVAGLGRAFTLMLPTFLADPRIRLVAAADPRPEARRQFADDFGAKDHQTIEALAADPDVEVVYLATPHQFHAAHTKLLANGGKHVLVEKPMAISLEECRSMIDAARAAKVHLIVGHSHSFDLPVLRARDLIAGGSYGDVRMIQALNYTDFMYRPRRPEELVTAQGGGVIFSQGAHQIDVVRLLGGGKVASVRAATGSWDPARPSEGAYSALLFFENGATASITYSGYAHFDSDEFCGWIAESGQAKDRNVYGAARKALGSVGSAADEASLKAARNYGGDAYAPAAQVQDRWHQHFGVLLVSCDRADIRPLSNGVMIYGDTERKFEALPKPAVPRTEVIDELYDAVVNDRPPLHSGAWAMATLEVCLAILESASERRDVALSHQIEPAA